MNLDVEFFKLEKKETRKVNLFNYFKYLYEFFMQNKQASFYGATSVMILLTFFNYNNNFNANKTLILQHVDYVYQKTEENLNYTKTLIEAEKTFFNRMCGYYEKASGRECTKTENIYIGSEK